jgi:magnesium chelatase family protein
MTNRDLKKCAALSPEAKSLLLVAADRLKLSARGYFKIIKLARTIADLENKPNILPDHISEALQYRM